MDSNAHTERPAWMDRAASVRAQAAEWRSLRRLLVQFGVEPAEADDLAQDAALALHRTSSVLDRRALVWGVARNTATRHLQTAKGRRQKLEEVLPLLRPLPAAPADELALRRGPVVMLTQAIEAVRATEPQLHEVLLLHLDGLTMPQIAAQLLVPYGTAESRFQRARALLCETMQRWAAEEANGVMRRRLMNGARNR